MDVLSELVWEVHCLSYFKGGNKSFYYKRKTKGGLYSMEIIRVSSREELDFLYGDNALTVVGLCLEAIPDLFNILKENTTVHRERVFITSGKLMNEQYGLTGRNAYKDDLTIVSVSLEDFDVEPMILKRFNFGGRWFNDVVDNNIRIEKSQRRRNT